MKPKPFESLNHFTVPIVIFVSYTYQLKKETLAFRADRILSIFSREICSVPYLTIPSVQLNPLRQGFFIDQFA
jgi:hypothetical protein